jgi:Ca-activated chloride channel family protein
MSSLKIDPYQILGVARDAPIQEIKSAYRQIARRLHPDVNPNNAAAAAQFQQVTAAHDLLTDIDRRSAYDRNYQQDENTLHFGTRISVSKGGVRPIDEPQVIYALVDVMPDKRARENHQDHQPRLNLTLVLDQSNSMKGARIEKVKIAAHQIIDNLTENDFISVVTFNDRSETIIEATLVKDKPSLKAKVSLITPSGGTEIVKGLEEGARQCRKFSEQKLVNHIILLTDGHTFGDQDAAIELADAMALEGIGISAMGLGHDWNDHFLDNLASRTGGSSAYINSAGAVVRFLNNHVRSLVNAFSDRMTLAVAYDPEVVLESAFRLAPSPQPLSVESSIIPLGSLQVDRHISVLIQLQLPAKLKEGQRSVARIAISGDILNNTPPGYYQVSDVMVIVDDNPPRDEPPTAILDALSKLTLYRLQERAQEALESGNAAEATRRLENLATRLLAMGKQDLAQEARQEAERVKFTQELSERGRKTLKYQTRHLLMVGGDDADESMDIDDEPEGETS